MTDYRSRPASGTLRARVWTAVRARGPMSAAEVAALLGITRKSASAVLCRLRRDGRITVTWIGGGSTVPSARFTALGTRAPNDRRGKSKASRNHCYANVLAMNAARLGPHWRPRVRPATELERFWPTPRAEARA